MNRVNNYHTIDDRHPVCDKLDHHHHAVASPGVSYSSSSPSTHSLQRTKMPVLLLRLDSVGEVSPVKHPNDNTSNNLSKVKSRPDLCNSQSFDSGIVSKTTRLLSRSTMAKLLCPTKNSYGNSHMSGSVHTESYNLGPKSQESGAFYGMNTCQKNSLLRNMNTMLMPAKMNEYKLFGSQSHQTFNDLETVLPPAVSCSLSSSIFSIAAACTACRVSSAGCSVSTSPQLTPSDKDSVSCVTSSPKTPATDVMCQICESNTAPSSLVEYISDQSSLSAVFQPDSEEDESSLQCDDVAAGEEELTEESVLNGECQQTEECSRSCDKLKCDSSQNSTSDEASYNSLISVENPLSVLSTPRKTTKKGRPSLKKQRKRQREKQKTCSVPLDTLVSKISTSSEEGEIRHCLSDSSLSEVNDSSSILFEPSCSQLLDSTPEESTPVKSQSKHCPVASFFFAGRSDSEETDDSDDGDVCEESGEWSVNGDENVHGLPKKCTGFNAPLNLDSVFKRKSIPTLKSVFWAEDSESESEASPAASPRDCQSSTLDSSTDDNSRDSSVEFSSPLSSPSKSFGFTCGLSLEALFTKKPGLVCVAAVKESLNDTVDGAPSSVPLSSNFEMCYDSIRRINTKWNENYPTAGFRSCKTISSEEITDPSIKVHFASGPSFLTVHIIGTEERAGTWHHFALDRERFQRRILDLATILSPVLEVSHRARVLERNHQI